MRYAAAFLALVAISSPAFAGEARQVPHGMEVTTDAGKTVRVLAYADGTFRVTVAKDLPEGRPTAMVVTEPDGEPQFSISSETATLWTERSSAVVGLSDNPAAQTRRSARFSTASASASAASTGS